MVVIGVDLGNKSRNGITLIGEDLKVIAYRSILYKKGDTPYSHRIEIVQAIREYIEKARSLNETDVYILFEKVNLFVGGHISKLNNIMSLAFIQATIINEFSKSVNIAQVEVRTWKSKVLGSSKANKDDAVNYVKKEYPDIQVSYTRTIRGRGEVVEFDHDLCDAICIARYGIRNKKEIDCNLVNFS